MERLLTEENGAASALVIFMTLALVTLGAFSIMSAHINYVFSGKALDWRIKYYECDALAEVFLMDLDAALAKAERNTVEAALSQNTRAMKNSAGKITPENAEQSLNAMYRNNILKELIAASAQYPGMDVNEDGSVIGMIVSADGGSWIELKISALPFRYSFESFDAGAKAVLDESSKRYSILEWKQAQKEIGADAVQEPLWDGIID